MWRILIEVFFKVSGGYCTVRDTHYFPKKSTKFFKMLRKRARYASLDRVDERYNSAFVLVVPVFARPCFRGGGALRF